MWIVRPISRTLFIRVSGNTFFLVPIGNNDIPQDLTRSSSWSISFMKFDILPLVRNMKGLKNAFKLCNFTCFVRFKVMRIG